MKMWTTETWVAAAPDEVLEVLTEPDAIARWAPIPFEVVDLDGPRLRGGTRARVRGSLAGRAMEFDVAIHEVAEDCLSLLATGPVSIEARYVLAPLDAGTEVRASVTVSGRGLLGGVLARACEAVLAGGALSVALARIGRELELQPALA